MVVTKHIAQRIPPKKDFLRTFPLLFAILFCSILLVTYEEPNGIETPVIDTPEEPNTINGFEYVDLGLSVK